MGIAMNRDAEQLLAISMPLVGNISPFDAADLLRRGNPKSNETDY